MGSSGGVHFGTPRYELALEMGLQMSNWRSEGPILGSNSLARP